MLDRPPTPSTDRMADLAAETFEALMLIGADTDRVAFGISSIGSVTVHLALDEDLIEPFASAMGLTLGDRVQFESAGHQVDYQNAYRASAVLGRIFAVVSVK